MNRRNAFVRFVLTPFAYLYGFAVWFRNQLFDLKILPSRKYDVPVICIGNITAGGTGKTPFTEYMIALLQKQVRLASLSRGYKRQTTGFLWVERNSTSLEAGDEACQIKQKFPDILVAVDANRRRGIERLLSLPSGQPDVILLDDAMQHRYVTPSLTIMLTDFNNIYYEDTMLPAGNLRESAKGVHRADIIVVTKCPDLFKPDERRLIEKNMMLPARQRLYFTKIKYYPLQPLFPSLALHPSCSLNEIENEELLLLAGIANPQPFIEKIKSHNARIKVRLFPDHHRFMPADIKEVNDEFQKMTSSYRKRIITTEKDAMRLKTLTFLPDEWKPVMYYLPMSVEFLFDQGDDFDENMIEHIKIN